MLQARRHSGPMRPRHRRVMRRVLAALVVVLVGLVVATGVSYGRALAAPGYASWQVRTVEWVRDHGGGWLVNLAENWRYSRNHPTGAAPASSEVPGDATAAGRGASRASAVPQLPLLSGTTRLPGEAQWVPSPQTVRGSPVMYTGWFRPDPAYPSQIVGVALLEQPGAQLHLIAGTQEPGGTWPDHAHVPDAWRSQLVAAFNAGWKLRNGDARGGYYAHGRTAIPLREGAASLVIDTSGRATVGQWGRDVRMGPQVEAVRQNLDLVVDGGHTVAGLADNSGGTWGSPRNQLQYTWRSGVGTDAAGNLIYLAGNQITLAGLGQAMVEAGIVRGMELDIHSSMVTFNTFRPDPATAGSVSGTKLLPAMTEPADRYLAADQRDFFAVTTQTSPPTVGGTGPAGG